ncbi:hypothetical protein AB0B31_35605 [Catellatospora citrea]|uniref:hypothetical protein n=1 Tax=Catellatospora citrea TaxID=53366 RepID=UPI0033D87B18
MAAEDPLAEERVIFVLGTYFAAGVAARGHGPADPDGWHSLYDVVLTYDRPLVIESLRTLITRIPLLPGGFIRGDR